MSRFFSTCSKHLSSRTWWLPSYRHLHHACSETQSACGFFQHLALAKSRVMLNWSTNAEKPMIFAAAFRHVGTSLCWNNCPAMLPLAKCLPPWLSCNYLPASPGQLETGIAAYQIITTSQLQESNQKRCQTKPKRTTKHTNRTRSITFTKISWALIQHPILWSPSHLSSFPLRLKCHGIQSFKMCVSFDCRYLSTNQHDCNLSMRWQVTLKGLSETSLLLQTTAPNPWRPRMFSPRLIIK